MTNEQRIEENKLYEEAKNWMKQNGEYKTFENEQTGSTTVTFKKTGEENTESITGEIVRSTISLYQNVR